MPSHDLNAGGCNTYPVQPSSCALGDVELFLKPTQYQVWQIVACHCRDDEAFRAINQITPSQHFSQPVYYRGMPYLCSDHNSKCAVLIGIYVTLQVPLETAVECTMDSKSFNSS